MADKFESSEIGHLTCLNLANPNKYITAIKMPLKLKIVSS